MVLRRWGENEELEAKCLLQSGHTAKEVAEVLGRSVGSIFNKNIRDWHIDLNEGISNKLSRSVKKVSYKISEFQKKRGSWSGSNNPNYGAKIVKTGKDNPLSIWKSQNPGYQDGEKNPSYGREYTQEEIKVKTEKIVEFAHSRKGRTYKDIYGEEKACEISKAMSKGSAVRISKQKSSYTKPEMAILKILDSIGIDYIFQHPIEYYCVDFYIPSKNLVIQVDGCYWHGHGCSVQSKTLDTRQKNRIRLDHSCDSYLKNRGYKVIRIWECEVQQFNKERLLCVL